MLRLVYNPWSWMWMCNRRSLWPMPELSGSWSYIVILCTDACLYREELELDIDPNSASLPVRMMLHPFVESTRPKMAVLSGWEGWYYSLPRPCGCLYDTVQNTCCLWLAAWRKHVLVFTLSVVWLMTASLFASGFWLTTNNYAGVKILGSFDERNNAKQNCIDWEFGGCQDG